MDGNDFYDYFIAPLDAMSDSDLAKLADYALPKDWYLTQGGRTQTALDVADAIYNAYFDTGAADDWGPATFTAWYIDGAIAAKRGRGRTAAVVH